MYSRLTATLDSVIRLQWTRIGYFLHLSLDKKAEAHFKREYNDKNTHQTLWGRNLSARVGKKKFNEMLIFVENKATDCYAYNSPNKKDIFKYTQHLESYLLTFVNRRVSLNKANTLNETFQDRRFMTKN